MLIEHSLNAIETHYFEGSSSEDVSNIKECMPACSANDLVIIFLLLLNVDKGLKHTVLNCELENHAAKLERFLLDLRQDLVVQFFIDDTCSKNMFITRCEECWVLA